MISPRRARFFLLAPLTGVIFGIWRYDLLGDFGGGYADIAIGLAVIAIASLLLIQLRVRTGRDGWGVVTSLALAVMACFVYYAGAGTTLAGLALVLAGIAIGGMVNAAASVVTQLLIGLAIVSAVVGWLLPIPVHYGQAYLLAVGGLLLYRRNHVGEQVKGIALAWRGLLLAHPGWMAILVVVGAAASLGLWLPTVGYDDNAVHLLLSDQLLAGHYYRLDVSSQVWALAPWANDVLHGAAAVLAGEDARAAIDAIWLLAGVAGAYRLARSVGANQATAIAGAAVFAAHPLTAFFTSTMQVDGAVAAILLNLSAELADARGRLVSPVTIGILIGLLAGLKASNALYVVWPIAWLGWGAFRSRDPKPFAKLVAAAALVGGSSYAYALAITGNPVFPLFNGIFRSPYMPNISIHDGRWDAGVSLWSVWDMTFETGRYGELYRGAAGVAFLAAIPGLVMEIVRPRGSRWLGLWFVVAGTAMFWQIQYLRYVFPAIVVLTTLGIVGFGRYLGEKTFAVLVGAVLALNVALLPTSSSIFRDDPWGPLLRDGSSARREIERTVIPERALLARLKLQAPNACVLMTDPNAPFSAGFGGRVNAMNWYDPRLSAGRQWAENDVSGARWQALLRSTGASHLIVANKHSLALGSALAGMSFVRLDSERGAELWASGSPDQRRCDRDFQRRRDQAHLLLHLGEIH